MTREAEVVKLPNTCYGTELGEGLASELLGEDDKGWLSDLHQAEVGDDWISKANLLVHIGSKSIKHESDKRGEIIAARKLFFEELFNWNYPAHKHRSTYEEIESKATLVALSTFIDSMRLLSSFEVSVSDAVHRNSRLATMSANAIRTAKENPTRAPKMHGESLDFITTYLYETVGIPEAKARALAESFSHRDIGSIKGAVATLEELGPKTKTIIRANPRMLCYPSAYIKRQVRGVELAGQLLDWEGNPTDLAIYSHRFIMSSRERLMVHARLFARFGTPDMSMSMISNLVSIPVESHFIAMSQGAAYDPETLKSINKAHSSKDRSELAGQAIIDKPEIFGEKLIRAYRAYKEKRG